MPQFLCLNDLFCHYAGVMTINRTALYSNRALSSDAGQVCGLLRFVFHNPKSVVRLQTDSAVMPCRLASGLVESVAGYAEARRETRCWQERGSRRSVFRKSSSLHVRSNDRFGIRPLSQAYCIRRNSHHAKKRLAELIVSRAALSLFDCRGYLSSAQLLISWLLTTLFGKSSLFAAIAMNACVLTVPLNASSHLLIASADSWSV